MISRRIYALLFCFVSAIGFVILLYCLSSTRNHSNGFIRLFPSHQLGSPVILDTRTNYDYIAGISQNAVYLAKAKAPGHLLLTNLGLTDTSSLELSVNDSIDFITLPYTRVGEDFIYIAEGNSRTVLRGSLHGHKLDNLNPTHLPVFNGFIPLVDSCFIIRTYNDSLQKTMLMTYSGSQDNIKISLSIDTIENEHMFSDDGMVLFDASIRQIVYVYYYKNRFDVLDIRLTLVYTGRTIDTVSRANITTATITSSHTRVMSSPPLLVNKKSCVSGGMLYVHSGLVASNEAIKNFNAASVIDMYAIKTKSYVVSFYIPEFKSVKMTDFKISGKMLFVLYDHYLISYELTM